VLLEASVTIKHRVQQTRGLPVWVSSLNPHTASRLLVYGLHFTLTLPPVLTSFLAIPWSCCGLQCTLQCAVIGFLGPRLTFYIWGWTWDVQVKLRSLENACHTWVP